MFDSGLCQWLPAKNAVYFNNSPLESFDIRGTISGILKLFNNLLA